LLQPRTDVVLVDAGDDIAASASYHGLSLTTRGKLAGKNKNSLRDT
jgi:hypothetical protein